MMGLLPASILNLFILMLIDVMLGSMVLMGFVIALLMTLFASALSLLHLTMLISLLGFDL